MLLTPESDPHAPERAGEEMQMAKRIAWVREDVL